VDGRPAAVYALVVEMEALGRLAGAVVTRGSRPWRGPGYGGGECARRSRGRPLIGREFARAAITL